jgi:arginase
MIGYKPPVRIFGVPMDLGQKRRGVDMGASALRYAGLQARLERLAYSVTDTGNINTPVVEQVDDDPIDGLAHNAHSIVEVCKEAYRVAKTALAENSFVVALGGDHSISMGTVSAANESFSRLGVLWVDAHGDFNTPFTTPSGNVHGMVVASLTGRCPAPLQISPTVVNDGQVAMIGIRDLDGQERTALASSGITVRTMRDIDERGMAATVQEIIATFAGCDAIHVSLDMDSLDPQVAHGVGTPVPGGLTYREAHLLMEMLADDGRVRTLDVVEINPILDDTNRTATVAVELVASLFGQRIL